MTTITVDDLFTPAPSGIGPQGVAATPPDGSWMAQNLENAATVGLQVTDWNPGAPTRSWLAISAIDQAKQDALISGMVQGGFLDWAASGTVSYVDPLGNTITVPVSPDPADPSSGNTTGAPTWLDMLGSSLFGLERNPASPATPAITFANTSSTTPSTYLPRTYHAQDVTTPTSTYSNDAALTISPSAILGTRITGIGTSSPVAVTTWTPHGLSTGQAIFISGAAIGSNANGFFQVTVTGPNSLLLNNSTGGTGSTTGTAYSTFTVPFTADGIGPQFGASAGDISGAVTSNSGVAVWNFASCTGANYESNAAYAARCRLSRAALSPNGASGAYEYFAMTAYDILLAGGLKLSSGPITRATETTNPLTGAVTTCVAPGAPGTTLQGAAVLLGATLQPITGASNASPILITCASHGLTNGELVKVSGVLGNAGANGTFIMLYHDADSFYLLGSTGTGTYTGGGQVEGGPLGMVDSVIQSKCVPDGDTAYTVSGLAQLLAIAGNVSVPAAQAAAYKTNAANLLASYVNSMPIGGYPLTGGGSGLSLDTVIGLLWQAGVVSGGQSYVRSVDSVTINGVAADKAYASNLNGRGVGVLQPAPVLTVTGV